MNPHKLPYFRMKTIRYLQCEVNIASKLETLVFNTTTKQMQKSGLKKMEQRAFVAAYNVHAQRLLFALPELQEKIEKHQIKPNQVMDEVDLYCANFDANLSACSIDSDTRLAVRWFMIRKLIDLLRDNDLATRVEFSIASHNSTKSAYRNQCHRILANIRNEKTGLEERIVSGKSVISNLGIMGFKEMWPSLWSQPNMQVGHRTVIIVQEKIEGQSLIQCHSCKQFKVTYYELQTRSADEPMTCFCTCQNCGKKWKM